MKNLFFEKKRKNTLTSILSLLKVKYTSKYANRHYNEHPNKYNLFGLSKMLTHFGISNMGVRITNKEEDIHNLETPFIAHIGSDFVTVQNVSQNEVKYHWNRSTLTIPTKEFTNIWTGATLIAEAGEKSIEPEYKEHRKEECVIEIQKILLFFGGLVLATIGFIQNQIYQNLGLALLLTFNLIGVYIGYLLVLKQMNIQSSQSDKICSLFAQGDCNDVLDSPAAKFAGVIGWSELGLSYFLSNVFILLFAPQFLSYLILINICALPYSFWSVWYQKFKAKTWCPLCLIVQVLFWVLFVVGITFGVIGIPEFTLIEILAVGLIYGLPFLIINLILPYLAEGQKVEKITQEFNSLRLNDRVFLSLLKEQIYHEVNKGESDILLGNADAKNRITVFTNPHCGPCARMHTKIEQLLKDTNGGFCIQYMLSSFGDELDSSNEFFIHINKNFTTVERNKIYDEWFSKGKNEKEGFFKQYNFLPDDNISEEYQQHIDWKEENKLRATPTVLFSGYELPNQFFHQIENLSYFANLDVDAK